MAGKTFGGPYTRTIRRQDSSVFYKSAPPVLEPLIGSFLKVSDPRPPPRKEASGVLPAQRVDANIIPFRHIVGSERRQIYRIAISMIRGNAGPVGAAPVVDPFATFITTSPRIQGITRADASNILPPLFGEYDPDAGGMFVNTPSPWRSLTLPYRQDSVFWPSRSFVLTLPVEAQPFIQQSRSYKQPWQQDNSWVLQPQIPSVFFPYEVQKFFNPVPPYKSYGASYRDVSGSGNYFGIFGPPNFIPQPSAATLYDIYHYYANHS